MLRILMYHRIAHRNDLPWLDPSLISATPEVFAQQIHHLKAHYDVVSMERVLEAVNGGKPLPKRPVLITFDDGYVDFAMYASPILEQYRLPATVFVPTAFPADPCAPFWWDRLYHAFVSNAPDAPDRRGLRELKRLQQRLKKIPHTRAMAIVNDICKRSGAVLPGKPSMLDWDQIRSLARAGVTIGSHSRTHPIMTQISLGQVREEIRSSQRDIRQQVGDTLPIFCYPGGYLNDDIARVLTSEGIDLAFSIHKGHNDLRSLDRLRLRRIGITPGTTMPLFRLRLLTVGNFIDRWRDAA